MTKNEWKGQTVQRHLIRSSSFDIRHSRRRRALTLVELLIVIIVIGILVSSILVASSGFINKGRTNNTQALLQIVADAVEEFKREQTAKPTITRANQPKKPGVGDPSKTTISYGERYGNYPPDELEVFSSANGAGLPGSQVPRTLAPGGAVIVPAPAPTWSPLRFYKVGDPMTDALEHRDQCAMIVAIETLSESAASILDRIPDKNRSPGALDADGKPALFLDRAGGTDGWDANDHQIRYILDDWGMPISYLTQRDWKPQSAEFTPIPSSNSNPGVDWNEASTEMIRMNGGQPIIMSYGPNGKDQLTRDAMEPNAKASLVGDFEEEDAGKPHGVIDNPLNDDNVYSNPALKEKLAKGIKP